MSNYGLLNRREIIDILIGDREVGISQSDDYRLAMPYLKGMQLVQLCVDFGFETSYGASRWTYMQDLLTYMENENRTDELLQYLFSLDRFSFLTDLGSKEKVEDAYKKIIKAVIDQINAILMLGRHELQIVDGHFYVTESGKQPVVQKINIAAIDLPYVHGLAERCHEDFIAGKFDGVITKSRTLMEEVLLYILEKNKIEVIKKGDLPKMYSQVKDLFNMKQGKNYDGRVNNLLNGLEKIVQSIAEMRNMNSDAHGAGSNRVNIRECEARLIMNSAITYCEYILEIQKNHEIRLGV